MQYLRDEIFRSLSRPNCRLLCDGLWRLGEQTVVAMTTWVGSAAAKRVQGARRAQQFGHVRDWHADRQTRHTQHQATRAPLMDWARQFPGSAGAVSTISKIC